MSNAEDQKQPKVSCEKDNTPSPRKKPGLKPLFSKKDGSKLAALYSQGYTYSQLGERFHCSEDTVRRAAVPYLTEEDERLHKLNYRGKKRGRKSKYRKRYTRKQKLDALRKAAADCGGQLSSYQYDQWRKTHPGHPAASRYRQEDWSEWLKSADVCRASNRYTTEQKLAALRKAAADCGGRLTRIAYEQWRETHSGHPAANTYWPEGWNKWLEAAGIPLSKRSPTKNKTS